MLCVVMLLLFELVIALVRGSGFGGTSGWLVLILPVWLFTEEFRAAPYGAYRVVVGPYHRRCVVVVIQPSRASRRVTRASARRLLARYEIQSPNWWPRWTKCFFWARNRDLQLGQKLIWAFQPIRWYYLYKMFAIANIVEPAYVTNVVSHHGFNGALAGAGLLAALLGIGVAGLYYFKELGPRGVVARGGLPAAGPPGIF